MIEILILPEIDQLVTRLIIFCVTGRVHLSQYCTSSREIATYNLQRSPNSPRRLPIGNLESLSQHYKLGLFVLDISLQTIYGNDKFHRKFNTPSWILIHIYICNTFPKMFTQILSCILSKTMYKTLRVFLLPCEIICCRKCRGDIRKFQRRNWKWEFYQQSRDIEAVMCLFKSYQWDQRDEFN